MKWILIGLLSASAGASTPGDDYGWTSLRSSNLSTSVKVTGVVTPLEGALNVESARVQGRVLAILAREGDHVKPGQALFVINSAECLSLAEEEHVAEKRQIAELIEGVRKREHQLSLRLRGDRCEVVANYLGAITKRSVESGASFNVGDPLVTILDTKRLSVELDIAERDVARVSEGQKVHFRLASEPEKIYDTTVRAVVPAIDATTRTSRVRLEPVPLSKRANLDGLIFGEIETGSRENVFTAPSPALVFDQNSRYVIKGPEAAPAAVEVDVLGEANGVASFRARHADDLRDSDQIATKRAIFLFAKIREAVKPR